MDLIANWIEEKIQEAMAKGELKNLPGEGKPINLEDDSCVPAEMRVSYRVLKNAGFVPREVELQKEISEMNEQLVSGSLSAHEKEKLQKKIVLKQAEVSITLERMNRPSKN